MQRAFYYGDLLFESILVKNEELMLIERHHKRLINNAKSLGFDHSISFSLQEFISQIQTEVDKSNINDKKNCRVRYTLYRHGDGFYLPLSNEIKYLIDVFDFDITNNSNTTKVSLYTTNHKACTPLSNLKTGNALLYVLASIWAKQNNWDDALLINQYGRIIESTKANLFWIKDGITFTPPLSEGCVAGVMREEIMCNENIIEKPCEIVDLENADQIFLTNAISQKINISFYSK
ncbi:MAG: aminotransferase class IV [Bacteroidetes bacterium]|nr:aminotransferase class IV [Bacteroidota bacterium]